MRLLLPITRNPYTEHKGLSVPHIIEAHRSQAYRRRKISRFFVSRLATSSLFPVVDHLLKSAIAARATVPVVCRSEPVRFLLPRGTKSVIALVLGFCRKVRPSGLMGALELFQSPAKSGQMSLSRSADVNKTHTGVGPPIYDHFAQARASLVSRRWSEFWICFCTETKKRTSRLVVL